MLVCTEYGTWARCGSGYVPSGFLPKPGKLVAVTKYKQAKNFSLAGQTGLMGDMLTLELLWHTFPAHYSR